MNSGGISEPVKWKRFSKNSGRYYFSTEKWDAISFVPRRNVQIHGFGINSNRWRRTTKAIVAWAVDDDPLSEPVQVEYSKDDVEKPNRCYHFKFHDKEIDKIKV